MINHQQVSRPLNEAPQNLREVAQTTAVTKSLPHCTPYFYCWFIVFICLFSSDIFQAVFHCLGELIRNQDNTIKPRTRVLVEREDKTQHQVILLNDSNLDFQNTPAHEINRRLGYQNEQGTFVKFLSHEVSVPSQDTLVTVMRNGHRAEVVLHNDQNLDLNKSQNLDLNKSLLIRARLTKENPEETGDPCHVKLSAHTELEEQISKFDKICEDTLTRLVNIIPTLL